MDRPHRIGIAGAECQIDEQLDGDGKVDESTMLLAHIQKDGKTSHEVVVTTTISSMRTPPVPGT